MRAVASLRYFGCSGLWVRGSVQVVKVRTNQQTEVSKTTSAIPKTARFVAVCFAVLLAAGTSWAKERLPEPLNSVRELSFAERMDQSVSASFREVDFSAALQFLSDQAGVNIVLSEKAKETGRPVSVHLVDMPLYRALEYLLKGQQLLFRYDGETIWVATREEMESEPLETRVFPLNRGPGIFAKFEPSGETRKSVALQSPGIQEMRTIRDILAEVIPDIDGSVLLLDERSGALIATHVPYYLQQIQMLLHELDIVPVQVLIETRFLEITLDNTKEWSLDSQLTADTALTKKGDADGTRGTGIQLSSAGTSSSLGRRGTGVDFTSFANQSNGLNLTFQGILTGTQYQSVIHALTKKEKTKTLSAPRVMTLNNQTATIKIVTEFVYPTRYEASVEREDLNSDGDFNDVVNGTRETRFINAPQDFVTKDLGILLHVTPSVGRDLRTITLALKPEVSEKKTDDTFGGGVSLPRFTTRNLETSVVIETGETVMLGGLMKDTTSITHTRVPILGSLPLLGALFRKDSTSAERSNLLIFVTAQIVHPSGTYLAQDTSDDPD